MDLGIQYLGFQYAAPKGIYTFDAIYFTEFNKLFVFAVLALFNMSAGQVQLF